MSYQIGTYIFESRAEYEAGLRDTKKLKSLKKRGRTQAKIARSYWWQVKLRHLHMESKIGRDFLRAVDAIRSKDDSIRKDKVKQGFSDALFFIRQHIMIPLYVLLGCAVIMLCYIPMRNEAGVKEKEELQDSFEMDSQKKSSASVKEEIKEKEEALPIDNPYVAHEKALNLTIIPQLEEYYAVNPDIVGWLRIPGTSVDYPVMYREGDNDYYLSHAFNGASDKDGLLVLDKRSNPKGTGINSLIHGHHTKADTMFTSLKNYTDEAYFEPHRIIWYWSLYEPMEFEVMAVFRSSVYNEKTDDFEYYNYIQMDSEDAFNEYVTKVKENALYDTGVEATWGDRLITLSTCEYSKENGRLVIVGREKK